MRTWLRSPIEQVCGNCSARIHRGEPVQILSSPHGHLWKKARCVTCAVGNPPSDLPALEDKQTPIRATAKPVEAKKAWTRVGDIDWKSKASR